ncbi:succinyltransferase [Corynebacterium sp. TAE3-ERU12]|uniref:DapH/DapD/GlmU-related protein n=1 Tax=Corynebacterium sp. TAE3-ERU12 TaxID=2849491 RepID=UPI001C46D7B2|nr:DapH/DapD/GlmU-related protein [Corynebacterium sp. TAE3-ERU12]MBV7295050.1 succinyltransferase [Corynebacterium sp. TAE3-ERU12]
MLTSGASAIGIANIAMDGTVLDTWYPSPRLDDNIDTSGTRRLSARDVTPQLLRQVLIDEDRHVEQVAVHTHIADLSADAIDAHDAYLRLHLLSHRVVEPFQINMSSVISKLNTVAWTNKGPCLPYSFESVRTNLRTRGLIHVYSIDLMPRMVDYVLPDHVRIAEAERVRLGAYLAPGTTVVREGFVSVNAGSLGPCKIEGRVSSNVTLGGGTNIQVSGLVAARHDENRQRVPLRVGQRCRIGVAAGTVGVDLGDDCVIDNNILIDPDVSIDLVEEGRRVNAWELAGRDRMHFYRDPDRSSVCMRTTDPVA